MKNVLIIIALSLGCFGQTTNITATHITDGGTLLGAGTICFTPINPASAGFGLTGVGQQTGTPFCASVTDGEVSNPFLVPDVALTAPQNICYAVTIRNTVTGRYVLGIGQGNSYGCVQPTGDTFDFDAFIPSSVTLPFGLSVANLHIQNATIDNCTGAGCASGGGTVSSVFGRTGTVVAQANDYSWTQISGKPTFATVATSGAYDDLTGKPTIPSAVTFKTNGTNNGSQLIYNLKAGSNVTLADDGVGGITVNAAGTGSTNWGSIGGTLSAQTDLATALAAKEDHSALAAVAESGAYSDLSGKPSLATVATSGLYADLLSKPQLAQTNAGATHQFLTSYDATTGLFAKAQVAYSDVSGTPSLATVATSGLYSDLTGKPQLAQTNAGAAHNFLTAYDASTGLFTKAQVAYSDVSGTPSLAAVATSGAYSDLTGTPTLPVGSLVGTTDTQTLTNKTVDGVSPTVFGFLDPTSSVQTQLNGKQASLGFTAVPNTRTVNGHALSADVTVSASDVGLGSVTNDVQTKAAIMPNTAPAAGRVPVGNAGGTAYAPVAVSGDCTLASTGVETCTKTNNVAFAASATTDTTNAANVGSGTLNSAREDASTVCIPGSFATETDGATVTWAIGSKKCGNATLTFTVHSGSRTLNTTGMINGGSYVLLLVQDATGGEGLTLGTGCTWKVANNGVGAITLSTSASAIDILAWTYDGTNCYANFAPKFN